MFTPSFNRRTLATPLLSAALTIAAHGGNPEPITIPAPSAPSPWEFRAEAYGWLTSLDGDIGLYGRTTNLDTGFDELLDHIDMAAALRLELRNGRWAVIADGFYCALSDSGTPPGPRYDSAKIKMKQFIGELDAAFRFAEGPTGFADVYGGFRYNDTSLDLHADGAKRLFRPPPDLDLSRDKSWTDPLIGLRGQWNINEKWFLAGKVDIGGFGVGSDLAWSLQATVGYNFTDSISTEIGYRYLNTDYDDGRLVYNMTQAGAYIGLACKF